MNIQRVGGGLRYNHATIVQRYSAATRFAEDVGQSEPFIIAGLFQRDHIVQDIQRIVGHGHQLHGFAFLRRIAHLAAIHAQIQRFGGPAILCHLLAHRGGVIVIGHHHQVILVDLLILLDASRVDGVVNRKSADNQRCATSHAAHGHNQTRLESEDIARSDFAEEVQPAPYRANPLQQYASARFRCLRPHQRGGRVPYLLATGERGGHAHADHEQHDAGRAVQPVVFKSHTGQYIQSLNHHHQECRDAEESDQQTDAAADQAGEQREQQIPAGHGESAIAESKVGADKSAVFLDHAGHGGQAHEHGDQQEHNRECAADGFDGTDV